MFNTTTQRQTRATTRKLELAAKKAQLENTFQYRDLCAPLPETETVVAPESAFFTPAKRAKNHHKIEKTSVSFGPVGNTPKKLF